MNTALKKKSLEESLSDHTSGTIESENGVEVVGDSILTNIYRGYTKWLEECSRFGIPQYVLSKLIGEDIITSEDITKVPSLLQAHTDHKHFRSSGNFLSALIQRSYNHGFNNFELDLEDIYVNFDNRKNGLDFVGTTLKGTKDHPLSINVEGIRGGFGYAKNVRAIIKSCLGQSISIMGSFSEDSVFEIHGDSGYQLGDNAKRCHFEIYGNTGQQMGLMSERCTFVLHGKIDTDFIPYIGREAKDSVFKFYDETSAHIAIKSLNKEKPDNNSPRGISVYLVKSKGNEEKIFEI